MTPRLTIALSTMGRGYEAFALPTARTGVNWIIVVQRPAGQPGNFFRDRDDIRVLTSEDTGLAKSRNLAVAAASAPWVLLCDDDITLDLDAVMQLVDRARAVKTRAHKAGFFWARLRKDDGEWMARYPGQETELTRRNSRSVQSASLLLSTAAIHASGIRFDERFGLGTGLPLGEEYILITDLMKHGWRGWHVPLQIGMHPGRSTGSDWSDPRTVRARAAVLERCFGILAPVVRMRYAWAHRARLGSRSRILRFALGSRFL